MTTVFGVMLQESSALAWQPSYAVAAFATILSVLLFWRCVKWGELHRAARPATIRENANRSLTGSLPPVNPVICPKVAP